MTTKYAEKPPVTNAGVSDSERSSAWRIVLTPHDGTTLQNIFLATRKVSAEPVLSCSLRALAAGLDNAEKLEGDTERYLVFLQFKTALLRTQVTELVNLEEFRKIASYRIEVGDEGEAETLLRNSMIFASDELMSAIHPYCEENAPGVLAIAVDKQIQIDNPGIPPHISKDIAKRITFSVLEYVATLGQRMEPELLKGNSDGSGVVKHEGEGYEPLDALMPPHIELN